MRENRRFLPRAIIAGSSNHRWRLPLALLVWPAILLIATTAASGASWTVKRVSTDAGGRQANGESYVPSISSDGRYVAFDSTADNLASGGSSGSEDIFVKDTLSGTIKRFSYNGTEGRSPSISSDGRFVAFASKMFNQPESLGYFEVILWDSLTGSAQRVSVPAPGSEDRSGCRYEQEDHVYLPPGGSRDPHISGDGRYVAFTSDDCGLVADGGDGHTIHPFVKDTKTGAIQRVDQAAAGNPGNSGGAAASISTDGRYVAFSSGASNLVPGDSNNRSDVFVKDLQTGAIQRVSTAADGSEGAGNDCDGESPSISANGRYVAFLSDCGNLVPGDSNGAIDVFVKDIETGGIQRVNTDEAGNQANYGGKYLSISASISADGRHVAFASADTNLVPGDNNGRRDIFLKDTKTGAIQRLSTDAEGDQGNDSSWSPSISASGARVAFVSFANNLVPNDTNNFADIFLASNPTYSSGGCTPSKPALTVKLSAYWASLADYQARNLSVRVGIGSADGPMPQVKVTGAPATNRVTPINLADTLLGRLAGGGSAPVLKYQVPQGVGSFKVSLSLSAKDACGNSYDYTFPASR